MSIIRLTNHGSLREPPEDKSAAFLSQGWWTLEMLRPILWHLEHPDARSMPVPSSPTGPDKHS